MLPKVLSFIVGKPVLQPKMPTQTQSSLNKRAAKERDLIRRESKIGAQLLGPIPSGHKREFFNLDVYTWIWHEQWFNPETKNIENMHVQYEFQKRGVLKTVNGVQYGYVTGKELNNLMRTIKLYRNEVAKEVYGLAPVA